MTKMLTVLFAVTMITACVDVETQEPGDPFCLEECLTSEPETENPSSEPPSTEPPSTEPPSTEPPQTEPPQPEPPVSEEPETPPSVPALSATFVSGHLGYYDGCPERAWSEHDSGDGDRSGDGAFCQDPDNCSLPCDPATLVIQLTNESDAIVTGVEVSVIELYGTDDILRASLPHEETRDLDTAELFDGTIDGGEDVTLRIEFAGPLDAWSLLQPIDGDGDSEFTGNPGIVVTTLSVDDHPDVVVESTEIYPISNIDT